MSIVTLVSGGLDSTLMALLMKDEKVLQFPLFVDYGQRAKRMELEACFNNHKKFDLPEPKVIKIPGYGRLIRSGLTDSSLDIHDDAFLPNRNLLFLLVASSYAYQVNAAAVAIGLLNEKYHIFPDQTKMFIENAQQLISTSLERNISIIAPLMKLNKKAVLDLAKQKKIMHTYSCHAGGKKPCGRCVSCLEIVNSQ